MKTFKEFQFAKIIFMIMIPIQIFQTFLLSTRAGNNPMTIELFVLINGVFAIAYLLFYGMTTTIDGNAIRITYGIGLIRKTIKISEIKSVDIVTNRWYYGWGIRFIPNGILYNINGLSGVELTFTDKSRIVRIGSQDSASLKNAITQYL